MSFISRTIETIRDATDEPSTNAKWTDAKLLGYIEQAYAKVVSEFNRVSKRPILVRYDISISNTVDAYVLPPTVGRILAMQFVQTGATLPLASYVPGDVRIASYAGLSLEGNVVRFENLSQEAHTLRILFAPANCVKLHTGALVGAAIVNDTGADNEAVITLPASATLGSIDNRPDGYAGSVFRILSNDDTDRSWQIDRVIKSHSVVDGTITVYPAYPASLLPADEDAVTYEIAPLINEPLDVSVGLWVARYIMGVEGDKTRYATTNVEYERAIRDVRLAESHFDMIAGHFFKIAAIELPAGIGQRR